MSTIGSVILRENRQPNCKNSTQNAPNLTILSSKLNKKNLGDTALSPNPSPMGSRTAPHKPHTLGADPSCIEWQCFCCLCFTLRTQSVPVMTSAAKHLDALAGTKGTDSWLDGTDIGNNFGPDLHLLFKMHEIWSVHSQENY